MGTFFWREKLWNLTGIIWSIIQPSEHNFEHNAPFSRVTPKSIMLDFTSIIRLTLVAIACRIKRSRSTNYVQKINVAFPDSFRSSYYNTWKKTNTRSQIDVCYLPIGGIFKTSISCPQKWTSCSSTILFAATNLWYSGIVVVSRLPGHDKKLMSDIAARQASEPVHFVVYIVVQSFF